MTRRRPSRIALAAAVLAAFGCNHRGRSEVADSAVEDADASSVRPMFAPRWDAGPRRSDDDPRDASLAADPEPEPPELEPQPGLLLSLPNGRVWGLSVGSVRAFLGIPFGIVEQRFEPAQPAEPWSGVLYAMQYGPACPQADNGLTAGGVESEDCLTLDVYTPKDTGTKLPVMVFIHGGAFVAGASSQYDATRLAETPMVVVAINYRLGPLGFFSHPALDRARPESPSGNDGIRDQQLALRWVRENIGAFNGDRSRITVFGESAGAISACIHWASPRSRGLAQRYILQSGTCTSDGPGWQTKADSIEVSEQLAAALCPGEADPIACLRDKPARDLVTWGGDQGLWGPAWQPTIDGERGVLSSAPERLIARARQGELAPLIVGTNKREWGFFQEIAGAVAPQNVAALHDTFARAFGARAGEVQAYYDTTNDGESNEVWMRVVSDMSFRCPARTLARLAANGGGSVWLYSFEQGPAFHAYEIDYVFGADWITSSKTGSTPSAALTAAMQGYWTRFAAAADPNGGEDPNWPRFETDSDRYLVLADPLQSSANLASTECDFWREYWRSGGTVDLR